MIGNADAWIAVEWAASAADGAQVWKRAVALATSGVVLQ